jgi:hypothetical protein
MLRPVHVAVSRGGAPNRTGVPAIELELRDGKVRSGNPPQVRERGSKDSHEL